MKQEAVFKGLIGTGLVFGGSALLAPKVLGAAYGITETTPELRNLTRMWGSRLLASAALAAHTGNHERDYQLKLIGIANVVDAIGTAYAGARDGAAPKYALMSAASSAVLAGISFWARTLD